jgi:hypothetical protein
MKPIITISFLFFYSILFSQELPLKDGKLHIEKVVDVEGTKDNFYTNARVWFTENFNSADAVIQMDDKDAGIIIGKGYSEVYVSGGMFGAKQRVFYTIKIQLKDEAYLLFGYKWPISEYPWWQSDEYSVSHYAISCVGYQNNDEKNEVKFQFAGIDKVESEASTIKISQRFTDRQLF